MTQGKHQLENNYFAALDNKDVKYFQKYNDDVKNYDSIHISLLSMDFPPEISQKERILIESEWIENLPKLSNIKNLYIRHIVDEDFFNAICKMQNLETLSFRTSKVEDISKIINLKKLVFLHLESFSKLEDIQPITNLPNLKYLSIDNCFKISNYEVISRINNLIALSIEGNSIAPKNLILNSLKEISDLQNLKHLSLFHTSIKDKTYLEVSRLKQLVRLDATWKMKGEIRDNIKSKLPNLTSGFFMAWDFEKNEFYKDIEWWKE